MMWQSLFNIRWSEVHFAYPWVLLLLLVLPLLYVYMMRKVEHSSSLKLSSLRDFDAPSTWRIRLRNILPWLRLLALLFLIIALARPQEYNASTQNKTLGYDIMLCLDVSWSMMAEDFSPNRISAATEITREFVDQRKGDKIGLIEFASGAIVRAPLTTDHTVIDEQLKKAKPNFEFGATAIGDALALAVDRIKDIPAKSKIVILLTDGTETSGYIDASTALEIAKAFDVKVYTIGIGSQGKVTLPVPQPNGTVVKMNEEMPLDEQLLQKIASETGAYYYKASDKKALLSIYQEINKNEKSEINSKRNMQTKDVFMIFVFISLIFILLEWALRYGLLRPLP